MDLVEQPPKGQEPIDIIGNVPYEVAIRILSHLPSAIQLSRLALLNSRFKQLANDDLLWKELCRLKWRKKRHMTHQLQPLVDYSHLISSLTIKEMKGILGLRHVNYKNLLEKSEFVHSVLTTLPDHAPKGKWSGKWKSSYIVALLDSTRTKMTTDELCSFDWNFHFLGHWLHPPQHNRSKFNRDKTYESDILERAMHWRWYDEKQSKFSILR
ncbi:hypothetical protein BJ742DRAFT_791753 [Cladochytrium replicatum]|nr:hypothetical protein BJ742DRAFT_791753 [Cladochytrium replicatum]